MNTIFLFSNDLLIVIKAKILPTSKICKSIVVSRGDYFYSIILVVFPEKALNTRAGPFSPSSSCMIFSGIYKASLFNFAIDIRLKKTICMDFFSKVELPFQS
jgi:hypothetical protein